jgi:hypothetical protein
MPPPMAAPVHYSSRRSSAGGNPMTRINTVRNNAVRSNARSNEIRSNAISNSNQAHSASWGSISRGSISHSSAKWGKNTGALIFAAVLIVCSLTVGCSSNNDKPKSVSSNNPTIPVPPAPAQFTPVPVLQAATKPAPKKVVPKKPATVNYTDQTYGVTFEYPRRYAIETGSAASDLLASNPLAMNFVEPGGVALAAVELPETSFANTDFSSAFFDVSVHKSLTADQCTEFAVPQPKVVAPVASTESASTSASAPIEKPTSTSAASTPQQTQPAPTQSASTQPSTSTDQSSTAKSSTDSASNSKLMLGDLELRATEAVSGEGARQSDSKYFHVFQNGSCYEFALNVTTDASEDGIVKHVDRDKVFTRLEQILSTVKIDAVKSNPVTTSEVTAETPTPATTPAQ